MASHSIISLRKPVTPEQVEKALEQINQRRYKGRLVILSNDEMTKSWQASRAWWAEVPDTRPAKPSKANPDENLGFVFWLHQDGRALEVRHATRLGSNFIWWVMLSFEHELARFFQVGMFDGGDGRVRTNPDQYKATYAEWLRRPIKGTPAGEENEVRELLAEVPQTWGWA